MAKDTVLLLDDDLDYLLILIRYLKEVGYPVVASRNPAAAIAGFKKRKPAMVVLDLRMPRMDGFECLRLIRQISSVPILVLSAVEDAAEKVVALKLGADDYVTKPFSIQEVVARIEAILGRIQGRGVKGPNGNGNGRHSLEVDLERHLVRVGGQSVPVTSTEYAILKCLLEADGKVLSREELLSKAWTEAQSMDLSDRTIDQHVARLRRKLGAGESLLVTVPKFGYRLASE